MRNRRKRPGVLLVFVLGTAMLIGVIGLSALMAARVQCRDSVAEADALAAQWYAQSAIEVAMEYVGSTTNWRTSRGSGSWFSDRVIDRGTMSVNVVQVLDGDTDPYNNTWLITGVGTCGSATRQVEYQLENGIYNGGFRQIVSTIVPAD